MELLEIMETKVIRIIRGVIRITPSGIRSYKVIKVIKREYPYPLISPLNV